MKHTLRSAVCTEGRRMAGARALWVATGMKQEQFGKPIIAIVNSFTQFVPGHTHLHEIGQIVREEIEKTFGYDLGFTCDEIRPSYTWGGTCQDSVPQAIVSFLDGQDFEDCIRNAISIGGDSDTIGCITGSIAEAFFGIPDALREQALTYLPEGFKGVITEFENKYGHR